MLKTNLTTVTDLYEEGNTTRVFDNMTTMSEVSWKKTDIGMTIYHSHAYYKLFQWVRIYNRTIKCPKHT